MTDPPNRLSALIIGQGLAGTCLGWALEQMGLSFAIIDPEPDSHQNPTSSRIAAGLVTPLTGPRLSVNWRYHELLPMADAFYRETQRRLASTNPRRRRSWWHEVEIARLILDRPLADNWTKRSLDPVAAALVRQQLPGPRLEPENAEATFGTLLLPGHRLDCAGWLEASRDHWRASGRLIPQRLQPDELEVTPDRVRWRGLQADFAVWCTGAAPVELPWFEPQVTRHQIGDILHLAPMAALTSRVLNGGSWLMRAADGSSTTTAGATYYQNDHPLPGPDQAREQLLQKLGRFGLDLPAVLSQQRATRPVFAGCKVVAGRSPTASRVLRLNGFGSKGVLKAPFFAINLAHHLWQDQPLDPAASS